MKSPAEKYAHDPQYRHLVDMMESVMHRADFTPSEMREAAMLASINYEMKSVRRPLIIPEAERALRFLNDLANSESKESNL